MPGLPINLNDLINASTVESERIDFKAAWNNEVITHSLCAFANDFHNLGGGYIIIGIEEKDGVPILPPIGLKQDQVEAYQKKLLEITNRIIPYYFPVSSVEVYMGKHILVLWATGGDNRPYKCPKNIVKDAVYNYYIRKSSNTAIANPEEVRQLYELSNRIPFDDRVNQFAEVEDLKLPLIRSYLKEVGSELYQRSSEMPFVELCQQMQIVKGPTEYIKPVNVGLLLFNDHPIQFFRGAKIEIVTFFDDVGDNLEERTFEGPIHTQLRSALSYIQNNVIAERVRKVAEQAEAKRWFNYPYAAIEEALANAVFHRSYEIQDPVEISIWQAKIEILSFPGPVPPVNNDMLKRDRIVARTYRNRRIGDFLKELRLTEGRATGFPKIRRSMAHNGSPEPMFETDEKNSYFLVTLPIHPDFLKGEALPPFMESLPEDAFDYGKSILRFCTKPKSRREILEHIEVKQTRSNYGKYIEPLVRHELLNLTLPDKPRSKKQQYIITKSGIDFLNANPD